MRYCQYCSSVINVTMYAAEEKIPSVNTAVKNLIVTYLTFLGPSCCVSVYISYCCV